MYDINLFHAERISFQHERILFRALSPQPYWERCSQYIARRGCCLVELLLASLLVACCRGGLSIFGIIAGLLAFVAFAGIVVYCCCFRRTQSTSQPFFQSRVMSQHLSTRCKTAASFIMVTLWNRADHYIFILLFVLLLLSFFYLFFPRLISAATDWMSTIRPHMVWP